MDPNINSETGEAINTSRNPRFNLWTAFLVFSIIVLISANQVVRTLLLLLLLCDIAICRIHIPLFLLFTTMTILILIHITNKQLCDSERHGRNSIIG
jgi:hypothetical protein